MLEDGYPRLDAYDRVVKGPTLSAMRSYSDEFLESNAEALKSYATKWVADPLHNWSRQWEYPFVFEQCLKAVASHNANPLAILDAGAGLTFFSHFLAKEHPNVSIECCDRDPQIESDAKRLAANRVRYSTQDLAGLSFADASFDIVYCISVLEHCERYEEITSQFARVLKPRGRLILTMDISLDGKSEIPRERAIEIMGHLEQRFVPDGNYARAIGQFDEQTMLTTARIRDLDASLLPWRSPTAKQRISHLVRHGSWPDTPFSLITCFCMGWTLQ